MLGFLVFLVKLCFAIDEFDILHDTYFMRREIKKLDFNETFFSSLENYQVNALPASEEEYPWIAKVVHSKNMDLPYMCTAVCIEKELFITAARCIFNLKLKHTSVVYKSKHLSVRAFVLPSKPSSQGFDDIGFIVIEKSREYYSPVQLYTEKRAHEAFQWFLDMDFSGEYKAIGYATEKGIHRIKSADRVFKLTELRIYIGMDLCNTILTFNNQIEGFNVPCYHSCTLQDFKNKKIYCESYHGVEGGAVLDVYNNKLLGLATWGAYFQKYELPVGIAMVNSKNFFEDIACARIVRDADGSNAKPGYFQKLCPHK